ncbi:1,4-dihydroxy-2-naphthoate polyprenyltransferase [Mammaliicoccus lentus]|uniref:1,4-dihydroxy-2-naphthoate polyprenyltransferase n=1 Tax=Mammaliicoccus lentus TaxID=42858 RepID=UPI003CF4D807
MSQNLSQHSGIKKYYHLMRPHTLTASFVPVLLGTAASKIFLTGSESSIKISVVLAMLLASILIQAATNMFNEYFDHKRGLDDHTSVGIGGAIVRNGMSPNSVYTLAIIFYIIALLLGVYICVQSTWLLIPIGLICMAIGYFYTGGPFPISWTPFGEIFAGFFMGFVIIMISFYIQTGTINYYPALLSIPVSITIGLINLANNIRDREKDKQSGRKTYAILVGKKLSILTMAILYIFAYGFVIYLALFKPYGSIIWLIALISAPFPIKAIRRFNKNNTPQSMMPAMAATGKANTIFGLLLALGVYISGLLGGL